MILAGLLMRALALSSLLISGPENKRVNDSNIVKTRVRMVKGHRKLTGSAID